MSHFIKTLHNNLVKSRVLFILLACFAILLPLHAFAAFPKICDGLPSYTPTFADPSAGKCQPGQTQISKAETGCAEGLQLVGCGKAGLAASLPVFGCCAEPKNKVIKCTPKADRTEGCGNASVSPNLSYECLAIALKPKCDSVGGEMIANSGTVYPSCGLTDYCCVSDVCAETPVTGSSANADTAAVAKTYKLTNPLGTANLNVIAKNVINTFLGIVGALALLVFVYAGISYMIAGGTEAKVEKAKATMKYAVIGTFIIMFSFVLTDTFIALWTTDIGPPAISAPDAILDAPTQAEQDVVTLKEQQQAAQKAEADAKAAAKTANTDVCGQTPATSGYTCQTLTTAEQTGYDCLSGYCQSQSASNYICCKKK